MDRPILSRSGESPLIDADSLVVVIFVLVHCTVYLTVHTCILFYFVYFERTPDYTMYYKRTQI